MDDATVATPVVLYSLWAQQFTYLYYFIILQETLILSFLGAQKLQPVKIILL